MCKSVLIVEDDYILAKMAEIQLEKNNYTIVGRVGCAKDAIELYNKHQPEIVLMDIQLKGDIDGIDAINQLKETTNFKPTVIYLTGNSDPITKKRAHESGCSGYLVKPVDEKVLLQTVNNAIAKKS